MGMVFVVVLEPFVDMPECSFGIRQWVDTNVVTLESLHECFRYAVRFRAPHRREASLQVQRGGKVPCVLGGVAAAIVGQPFDRVRHSEHTKPLLDGFEHHVPNQAATDPGAGNGRPGDDLVGVDGETDTHHLAVPTGEYQPLGTPAQVGVHDDHFAFIDPALAPPGIALQQRGVTR